MIGIKNVMLSVFLVKIIILLIVKRTLSIYGVILDQDVAIQLLNVIGAL